MRGDEVANAIARKVSHRSDAYKGWSIVVDTKAKYRKEVGSNELISVKKREEMWFINPDCEADRGDMHFAWRSLVRNPGEPHIDDDWLTNEFWVGTQNVSTSGTNRFVSREKRSCGFMIRKDVLGLGLHQMEIESIFSSGPMCIGPSRLTMAGNLNDGWLTDLYRFEVIEELQHLAHNAWKMRIATVAGYEATAIILKTEPPIVVECIPTGDMPILSSLSIDRIRQIDGLVFPARGVFRSDEGLLAELEFEFVSANKLGSPSLTDWPMQIPSGAEATDFMTGAYSEIPFTPDQYDKIRKWLLENAETQVTSRYARYLIIGSIIAWLLVVIGLLLYRRKKARV